MFTNKYTFPFRVVGKAAMKYYFNSQSVSYFFSYYIRLSYYLSSISFFHIDSSKVSCCLNSFICSEICEYFWFIKTTKCWMLKHLYVLWWRLPSSSPKLLRKKEAVVKTCQGAKITSENSQVSVIKEKNTNRNIYHNIYKTQWTSSL